MLHTITIDNVDECKELIHPDILENLGREYYRGIYSTTEEGEACGVMTWILWNMRDGGTPMSHIQYFRSVDSMTARELLEEYTRQVREIGVAASTLELLPLSDKAKEIFRSGGFELEDTDNWLTYVPVSYLAQTELGKAKVPSVVVPLKKLSVMEISKALLSYSDSEPYKNAEDIELLPPVWYDGSVSCAVVRKDHVDGIFMIHRTASGDFSPELFIAHGPNDKKDLLSMLAFAFQKMYENSKPGEETYFKVQRIKNGKKDLLSLIEEDLPVVRVTQGYRVEKEQSSDEAIIEQILAEIKSL